MSSFGKIFLGGIAAFVSGVSLVAIGVNYGKDMNEQLVVFVKEKNLEAESVKSRLSAEITSLKLDLQRSLSAQPVVERTRAESVGSENINERGNAGIVSVDKIKGAKELGSVRPGSSRSFFEDDFQISLIGMEYASSPLRQVVTGTLLNSVGESIKFAGADVGTSYKLGEYQVRIISINSFDVTFQVSKI